MPDWKTIGNEICQTTRQSLDMTAVRAVGGGCINSAFVVGAESQRIFVKTNAASRIDMFAAEFAGLQEMANSHSIRVPAPICYGVAGDEAYLAMEYLPLGGSGNAEQLGERLAAMHQSSHARYGWYRDNTIGSTPQINAYEQQWIQFWRVHRLGYQLELAMRKGAPASLARRGQALCDCLEDFFGDYQPQPSLLHGDLWSGNYAFTTDGEPVIFDPAVYFGDREADIAMTELFGGFPARFYAAYEAAWPLDAGYGVRKTLYNLYHILNHFNLFGGGYLSQAEGMIGRLLSERN